MPALLHRLALLLGLAGPLFLFGCSSGGGNIVDHANLGGSEVVGILVDAHGAPHAQTQVIALSVDSLLSGQANAVSADTAITDSLGRYQFRSLARGMYNLSAEYDHGALVCFIPDVNNDSLAPQTEPVHVHQVGTDTLRPPGWIEGRVIIDNTDMSGVACFVPGASLLALSNDTGGFTIGGVPQGTYRVYFYHAGYLTGRDTLVMVTAGRGTFLPPLTLQIDPAGAPPPPRNLTATYDSLSGSVRLSWHPVAVADAAGYSVYRIVNGQTVAENRTPVNIQDTFFVDTVKQSLSAVTPTTLVYFVTVHDRDLNESDHSVQALVSAPPSSLALHDAWRMLAPLSAGRRLLSAVFCNGSLYAFGGCFDRFDGIRYKTVATGLCESFNPDSSAWRQKAPLLNARFACVAGVLSGHIYALAGSNERSYVTTIEDYNAAADIWTAIGQVPIPRCGSAACMIGDSLYIFGGLIIQDSSVAVSARIDIFNVRAQSWLPGPTMLTPRAYHQVAYVNGTIYIAGGLGGDADINNCAVLATVERFDPAAGQSFVSARMQSARSNFGAVALNNKLYVFGGLSSLVSSNAALGSVEIYDPATQIWRNAAALPVGCHSMAAAAVNGTMFCIGGTVAGVAGNQESAAVLKYYP
ncbi:MAG: kelch repeat-containing protein [Chitinivibrionales bacterium]|nr:kelch repeat-containing protein [Chitinivibrionales bacterium]